MNTFSVRRSTSLAIDRLISERLRTSENRYALERMLGAIRCRKSNALLIGMRPFSEWQLKHTLNVLDNFASHEHQWERIPEMWMPEGVSAYEQMRSFLEHLFVAYEIPSCVTMQNFHREWYYADDDLFFHLASGQSLRTYDHHERITKAMVPYFMQSPDDLTIYEVFRWAQVKGFGADDGLARFLATHDSLFWRKDHQDYWDRLIRFLIQQQPMSQADMNEVIEFFSEIENFTMGLVNDSIADERFIYDAFSFTGRTLQSVRRLIGQCEERLAALSERTLHPKWPRTEINELNLVGDHIAWVIEELRSAVELVVEGSMMNHCVATYIQQCSQKETSIWSMKQVSGTVRKRILTIEVDPKEKLISQVSGKSNRDPTTSEWKILKRWAREESLTIEESLL